MLQHFEVILSYYVPTYYYNMISKNFDKVSANSYPIYHTYLLIYEYVNLLICLCFQSRQNGFFAYEFEKLNVSL